MKTATINTTSHTTLDHETLARMTPTQRFMANACELSRDAHNALAQAPEGRGLVHLVRAKMDADAALIEAVTALNKLDQAREEA